MSAQRHGERRVTGTEYDDGKSRPFRANTARELVAQVIASWDGWIEVRPVHWAQAGAIVQDLKAAGWLRTTAERRKYMQEQEQAKGVDDGKA